MCELVRRFFVLVNFIFVSWFLLNGIDIVFMWLLVFCLLMWVLGWLGVDVDFFGLFFGLGGLVFVGGLLIILVFV